MLHLETIDPSTLALLKRIQSLPEFANTRLVGGTSLALQLGHRISVDLDMFGDWIESANLFEALKAIGKTRKTSGTPDGKMQFFFVNNIKVDCVNYAEYPWLAAPIIEDGVRLASIPDIAAMKINAITNRGTRKDFVDLSFLLNIYDIKEIFKFYLAKYPEANPALSLRSMAYFTDAEQQPMPRLLQTLDWNEAKSRIQSAIRTMIR